MLRLGQYRCSKCLAIHSPSQVVDVHLLVTIAACGAIALADWAEAAAVAVLFALAEHWERCSTERARDAVQAVLTLRPESGAAACMCSSKPLAAESGPLLARRGGAGAVLPECPASAAT